MDKKNINFIEEAKISKTLKKNRQKENDTYVSNPLKADLMKFVHFKNKFNKNDLP